MEQLGAFAILSMAVAYYMYSHSDNQLSLPGAVFDIKESTLTINRMNEEHSVLTAHLGVDFNLDASWIKCRERSFPDDNNSVCVEWENMARFEMSYNDQDEDAQCYTIVWQALTRDHVPYDCIDYGEGHWYGGAQTRKQRWPIEQYHIDMQPYLGEDIGFLVMDKKPDGYGAVLERYWVSSRGVAFYVEEDIPLNFGNNENRFCLKADYQGLFYPNPENALPELNYTICVKDSIKSVHKYMANRLWEKPLAIPDKRVLGQPIWSTWARYKVHVNQSNVLQYAKEIYEHGFTASQIEIDDMYTPFYGDFEFDKIKFPNATDMNRQIHELGYRVTSWIMPFANIDSKAFQEGTNLGYWVLDRTGKVPGMVRWWQGIGVMLDVTNPDAVDWFFRRLKNLKDVGVDSFKFDAGETSFLPPCFRTHKALANGNPNQYSTMYADVIAENSDRLIEVRVGYQTQHLPIMVRMFDKNSEWGYNVGLKTMIPTALQFGIIGYPFILPDMIGGNAYDAELLMNGKEIFPDKELFIRWLELTAFLPAMQFSIAPWQYDEETTAISLKYVNLHESYVSPLVLNLAEQSQITGDPIIRPLWWVAPHDANTFTIDSQFLVGNDLMVAPILDEGATSRDIYLPTGTWKDILRGGKVEGERWLKDYTIQLDEIAYFERT